MSDTGPALLFTGKAEPSEARRSSGRGRPTREQSDQRHRELLDGALDLFLERGFDGTSIEAIVDSLGMARRTVYARYGDKLTLFKAALQRAIDGLVISDATLRRIETDNLEETLLNITRGILAAMRTPEGLRLTRIANAEVFTKPEIGAYLWEKTSGVTLIYLTDLFERRLEPKGASDAALAFYQLMIDGAFRTWLWLRPSDEEIDRQIVYRIRLFMAGVGRPVSGT